MLIDLPKEILLYIISIVVYDTFLEFYAHSLVKPRATKPSNTIRQKIEIIENFHFDRAYIRSAMGRQFRVLAGTHPKMRQILVAMTKKLRNISEDWSLDGRLFCTLIAHAEDRGE